MQAKLSIGIVAMIVACLVGADAARAGNLTFHGFDPPATYTGEAVLTNQVTDAINVGVGGRYWRALTQGLTHCEGRVSGDIGVPQPVDWRTDNAGVFFQTGLRFGPNLIISSN